MAQKILIVDDSATIRQELQRLLKANGYDVIEAGNGMEGADKIARHADLAMVICDVNMPLCNGIDMVTKVKESPRNAGLPIVMLTTEGSAKLIMQAQKAGAKGWIVKPFKNDQLLSTVKKLARAA